MMMPAQGGPIFIGGVERSGKTYLRLMLSANPRLAISRRTNMWSHFYGRFGPLDRPANLDRCLAALRRRKQIRGLIVDEAALRRDFLQGPPTYGRLFALIHRHHAERQGSAHWGDQTELVEAYAGPLFAAYPDARLIQLVRDPRDRFAALFIRDRRARGRLGQATAKWLYSMACARRNREAFPGQVLLVHYERLVSQPEETMRDVSVFLGEAYTPVLSALAQVARFSSDDGAPPPDNPLTTRFIGQYRRKLSRPEIAFIQAHAGPRMREVGYTPDPLPFSARKRAQYYLGTWLPHSLQMAGWRAWHARRTRATIGTMKEPVDRALTAVRPATVVE